MHRERLILDQQLTATFEQSNLRVEGKSASGALTPKLTIVAEGLVLKAAESRYNDPELRWVKLKVCRPRCLG